MMNRVRMYWAVRIILSKYSLGREISDKIAKEVAEFTGDETFVEEPKK